MFANIPYQKLSSQTNIDSNVCIEPEPFIPPDLSDLSTLVNLRNASEIARETNQKEDEKQFRELEHSMAQGNTAATKEETVANSAIKVSSKTAYPNLYKLLEGRNTTQTSMSTLDVVKCTEGMECMESTELSIDSADTDDLESLLDVVLQCDKDKMDEKR